MNVLFKKYKEFKATVFFYQLNLKKIFRRINNQSFYHVIGDSHVLSFLHEAFTIHHIGSATAYKLSSEKSTTNSRKKIINLLNKIYKEKPFNLIFVFGEIDARIHINKTSKNRKTSISKVAEQTISSYMNFLKLIKEKYPLITIYIFNVLPQGEQENIYNVPFYASRKERSKIVETMNRMLKEYSKKNDFKFIYIYDKLIDKNGKRQMKYIFDDVHFNRKIIPYVLDSINKINK